MTNTKTILGISFAAVFAAAMIFAPTALASSPWLELDDEKTRAKLSKSGEELNVKIVTNGDIPTDGSQGAFGYGVITGVTEDGPENVLALTTHMCAADSPVQGADGDCPDGTVGLLTALGLGVNEDHDGAEFHAHVLDLTPVSEESACASAAPGAQVEVDLERTLATGNNVSPEWEVELDENEIEIDDVPVSDLASSEVVGIAAFTITGVADNAGTITNLCVTLQ